MNLLFWNLKGNDIKSYIERCLSENNIDIAIFAEHTGVDFSKIDGYQFIEGMGGCEKIVIVAKKNVTVNIKQEQSRYVLYHIIFQNNEYILTGLHLHDRRNTDTATRIAYIGRLVNDICNMERKLKCKNTIIIGDFNANPFDDELLQMNSFNAVLFKEVIRKSETKKVDEITYRRFYNPTVHFISECTQNYGSFYLSSGSTSLVWHCLDQVLLGKALIDNIVSMKYLKSIGDQSLLKTIIPNADISDHLPLVVELI